jgi:hypothetical protein
MMERIRWWLAEIFACWAYGLMRPEMTVDPNNEHHNDKLWFEYFAMALIRHKQNDPRIIYPEKATS